MNFSDYPEQEPLSENGKRYTPQYFALSKDVRYEEAAYGTDVHQRLAIVRSDNPDGRVLMFMYGGGWTNGYKEMMLFMAPHLVEQGVTFVSVGYRLAPSTVFPEGWLDSARALAWIYRNIEQYGGDSSKIFVGGWSAGGHYASLLSTRDDWKTIYGVPRSVIKGCVTTTGVFDFTPNNGMSVRPRFLGPEENDTEYRASSLFHVTSATPPFLLTHGGAEKDFAHLVRQAQKMESVLRGHGVPVKRLEFSDHDHFSLPPLAAVAGNAWTGAFLEWSTKVLTASKA